MHSDTYHQKIDTFLRQNMLLVLPKDLTIIYQKHVQPPLQQNNILTEEHRTKYVLQINPVPPQLKSQLKIHKEDIPIRPAVNHNSSPA